MCTWVATVRFKLEKFRVLAGSNFWILAGTQILPYSASPDGHEQDMDSWVLLEGLQTAGSVRGAGVSVYLKVHDPNVSEKTG